jgi:hypothetical protein
MRSNTQQHAAGGRKVILCRQDGGLEYPQGARIAKEVRATAIVRARSALISMRLRRTAQICSDEGTWLPRIAGNSTTERSGVCPMSCSANSAMAASALDMGLSVDHQPQACL